MEPGDSLMDHLDFTTTVARDGYVWWYVDGMSDDGDHGLTIIAFIGSVFSPYYARARRRGDGDPENFVSINVALYGKGGKRWAMTERAQGALARSCLNLRIGPSELSVDGDDLVIRIDETTVPWPRRLRGDIRVRPELRTSRTFELDADGRHRWAPIAPRCRLDVDMQAPARSWSGLGYLDRNQGDRPLEEDFSYWDWSRANIGSETAILYDVVRRDGTEKAIALRIDEAAGMLETAPPPRYALPTNGWRVPRRTQTEGGAAIIETLEDTPFYSRSTLRTQLEGKTVTAMHESLSLDRFRQPWVQTLLPFRMPRRN
ncbi:MAG: carotenoid 1,2-hydratase [Pseudomonadota bacterium]